MQPLGDMAFDHVITWQIKNIISELLLILQSPNLVGTHMRVKWYRCFVTRFIIFHLLYSCMSFKAQPPRRL